MRSTARLPIGLVMGSFDPGGTERQMIELVRRLDRSRWDVHVACLKDSGAWLSRVIDAAPCTIFPVSSLRSRHVTDQLRSFVRWCRESRFAVVHALDTPSNIFGLPGAALATIPVRAGTRRDINPGRTRTELAAQRAAYACAHVVVGNSNAVAERLRFERIPPSKIAIVANGLDIGQFQPRRLPAAPRRVITVANLRPEKGQDVLIEAAAIVLARFPDARFELVGGGSEDERLRALARARGVFDAFTFSGHSEDVPVLLAQADIFVLPSRSEAFPNAVIEAMAAGLPVVASAVGGILELVADGQTGLLVDAANPPALADRLCALMANGRLAARLGAAGRIQVETRYSFNRMVSAFEQIYLEQLARRGLAPSAEPKLAAS